MPDLSKERKMRLFLVISYICLNTLNLENKCYSSFKFSFKELVYNNVFINHYLIGLHTGVAIHLCRVYMCNNMYYTVTM